MKTKHALAGFALLTLLTGPLANSQKTSLPADQMAADFKAPERDSDYEKRVVMVPMRDGVKLYTVIVLPKGAKGAPILLTRTPYNAAARAERSNSPRMVEALPLAEEHYTEAGYIRVFQDVRGKYGSEGVYLMTPPPLSSGYNPSGADDTTDAWDTIDWLVKNVPESNGRVGMIGSSYEGFTVVMALLDPHPALKAAVPESPMIDGWMGDDWYHNGAFREGSIDYFLSQMTRRGSGVHVPRQERDAYTTFLKAGSADSYAKIQGAQNLPFWRVMKEHPAYDGFWQSQALDKLITKRKLTVPTLWEQGLFDQEDIYGAIHSYRALVAAGTPDEMNRITMGPWFHSQVNREGRALGPLTWATDTTNDWRRYVVLPFFNQYLKPGSPAAKIPNALVYDTGLDRFDNYQKFPVSCEKGCPETAKPLYLSANGSLSFEAPKSGAEFDEYVSDPAKPVPYRPRPVDDEDSAGWRSWLVTDQRFVDGRPDVLTFVSEPLKEPMKLAGEPVAHLTASTSGTDSDWVVKLIDVAPDRTLGTAAQSGYELPVSIDILRGRYRQGFDHAEAIAAHQPLPYVLPLPMVNHTFAAGHRIMVQVQSTLFPVYDRNPQKFVENILTAKPEDFQKATQRIWHAPGKESWISLPIAPAAQ